MSGAILRKSWATVKLPPLIRFESHREFVRKVVAEETQLRKRGTEFVDEADEGETSLEYREAVNADGSPSETVSATYSWTSGTELVREEALETA